MNVNLKFCIFKLVYSWLINRSEGVGEGDGLENWKINSRVGVEEILFDMLK